MVKVKPTELKNKISVKASVETNVFSIKDNLSEFYAKQAENWAHSEGMVNGLDYSSKYYAEQSKISAENSQKIGNIIQENYNSFMDLSSSANMELQEVKGEVIDSIGASKQDAIDSIETSKQDVINEINSTKTTILNDIEFVADGEKQEIEELIDSGKDELKEAIGDVKVLTTLEIGDIGFTQMAIDESKGKRRVLNGQLIIQEQYAQFANIIKNSVALNPDLACTEEEWQTAITMSTNGICYKFVIDDDAGTIRLPKYPTYLDLSINTGAVSQTVSVYGNGKTLGLTDGATNYGLGSRNDGMIIANSTAYNTTAGTSLTSGKGTQKTYGVVTNASKSGLTGKVTVPAVQSEKMKGTYFIQVATGAETEDNIINEIELNNPFSLLDYKYSEYELNNISWLRSEGQYNSKAIYPAVYDLLLKIYNGVETKAGVSVKLTTETFTDYDFVLNTAEETFRLPVKVKLASGKAVAGNGMTLGLTDGTTNYGGAFGITANNVYAVKLSTGGYGKSVGSSAGTVTGTDNTAIGITTDPTKSGIETSDNDLCLYFYVGETVQNANLVNIGRIQETYTTKSMVDGQVEVVNQTLASNVSLSNTIHTYDLSGYIPNDGYNYEIQVGITGATSATSGAGMEIRMGTDISPLGCGFVGANTPRTNATVQIAGNINLVVGMERKLYLQNSSSTSSFSLTFLRLGTRRRLGTNL